MKTTIRDVASAAGVSSMAVSAVLHGSGTNVKVSAEKAELIRKIAKELHYRPNSVARSLRNQRTRTIGVVFQHFSRLSNQNPYYPMLLNGVMAALIPADYTLALCPKLIQGSGESNISDGRFDGVLWCRPDFNDTAIEGMRHANIPVVMMHAPPGSAPGVPTFCADNVGAMKIVVDHLVSLGHTDIGFVVDPVSSTTAEARVRSQGFLDAAAAQGVNGEILIWDYESLEIDNYRLGRQPHTALVGFSDHVAVRILNACRRFDVRVPQELSVVGFDSSPYCDATTPRLTSMFQPVERIAFDATTHLLSLVAAQAADELIPPTATVYACRLDLRESTGPPYPMPKSVLL